MKKKLLFSLGFICLFAVAGIAQDKPKIKFGKVGPVDFNLSAYKIDPGAEAVVIMDAGETEFVLNQQQQFALQFKRQKRVKLINKNGFDAATVEIPLYNYLSDEEKLDDFEASTYNLENGKVIEVKVSVKDIFTERLNKNWVLKKFTFPVVNEGSLIEYSYTIHSNFIFNLQPWTFQGEYPCLWSEFEVDIPEYFQYVNISQGYLPFTVKKTDQTQHLYKFTTDQTFNSNIGKLGDDRIIEGGDKVDVPVVINTNKWAIKDVPGLKQERFTSSVRNFISRIEFQLSSIKYPQQMIKSYYISWNDVTKKLLEDEDFGISLTRPNNWLDDDIKLIVAGSNSLLDKAKKITQYLKNNFTSLRNGIYLTDNLRNIFKNHKGSVADINLLLTDMLRHEKIPAEPVILSTKSNGYVQELYPLIDRFNYVVCEAVIDGRKYYLDATEPHLGFGILPLKCYNGYARIISGETPRAVIFSPDSVHQNRRTTVFWVNDEKNNWVGSLSTEMGYYESVDLREEITAKGIDEYFKKIKTAFPLEATFQNQVAEPFTDIEKPLTVSYDFDLNINKEDVLYINPMLTEVTKDNPFKSVDRKYPVEMSYPVNEEYIANIDIPVGYDIDELPKPEKILFNGDDGLFEYMVQKSGSMIILKTRLMLSYANYKPEDYEGLRDFYGKVVKKENEMFVFKRKK